MVRSVLGTDVAFGSRSVAGRRGRSTMSSSNRLDSKEMVFDARLALNENPKNPNPKNRGYYSSATLFIGDTVHRRHCSSAILFIAVTIHRRYCSSRLLFIAVTIHRRYCSSRLLFIAATVHRDYCSSPLLFIAATIHRRYCSSPLLFIAATVHRGYYSSPLLFIAATVHRRYCSSRLLFIAATVHRRYCSSPLLFVAATVHRGYYSSPLLFITILFIVGTVHRSYCSSRYCSSSTLFIAVLFAVRCSSDVVVATITHPAVGTTVTVDVDPIPAVVEGEDDVVFPNHNTRPNDTIAGIASLIEGHGQAHILLSKGTHLELSGALFSPSSKRSLLSFKDIRLDGFHIETKGEGNKEFLNIIEITKGHKKVLETIPALSTSLYYAKIDMIEANMAMNKEFIEKFTLWHDRLGHPGHSMMRKLITNSKWHTLREKRVIPKNLTCEACSQGKLIIRPSPAKVNKETLNFLERIQGDICGPIHPPCGTFRYFMVLIDASTRWSHVCLLSTRNQGFARLLAQIIRLRAHFPDFPLKTIRLDNAGEFTSQAFNDYCMSMGVSVEHPVAHVHTQNGLAESFIKRIQLIARPLLMRSKLPVAAWGHTVLHASELIRIRPSSEHRYSPSQLLMGHEPDISHLKTFGCAVYVPIAPPHRTKMGPKRRMGIYVGFDSPTIIKYLEPTTGDLFKARYADCHFNESEFPTLGGETNKLGKDIKEISWNQTSLNWQDPRTLACESEVQKIINLQKLANELPDSFVDPKKVTKSYIPACNAPVRIDIQKGINEIATESNAQGIELKDKDKKGSRDQYCIRLNKSLYGLKQSGRMWYNRLSDYLVREGYKNDPISPCIFIKKFTNKGFVIIAVYVDDLNILGTSGEIAQTVEYLKKEFEMKDLGKTKFCLGLQLEYVNNGILVHQKAYTEKVLKRFNMDQAHPLSSPMVVRSLGLDSDPFGPKKDEEEVLGPEVPYLQCHRSVNAVFFKAQLLQHQRPSYEDTTQPVSLSSRTATSREIGRSTFYQSSSSRMTYKGMEKFECSRKDLRYLGRRSCLVGRFGLVHVPALVPALVRIVVRMLSGRLGLINQDLHRRPLRPGSRPRFYSDRRALLLIEAWLLPRRPGIGRALQRHPFSGLVDSADERFARQYRCGPPPEFPLASPRSGIVHHLSGPDRHAHTRTLLRRSRSVGGAPARDPANQLPCALRVYSPVDSHTCQTPWSVFKTGRMGSPQADARSTQMPRHAVKARAADHDHGSDVSAGSFSSLPRGTCSLSVSRPYLALDGIYRPIGAAFPNNPTRRQRLVVRQGPDTTGLSPSLAPLSRELRPGPSLRTLLQTTIRTPKTSDFQAGLFPVRSPLLRESLTLGHLQLPDRSDRQYQMDHVHHRMSGRSRRPWLGFRPTACGNTRETSFRPASAKEYRGRRFVTPRQTCPRPEGLGRNLRSKTRWFTGFCNSHQVSHFATFFIDARAEISVAESRFRLYIAAQHPRTHRLRGGECQPFVCLFLDTFRRYAKPRIRRARDRLRNRPTESGDRWFAGRSVLDRFSGLLATSRAANHPRRRDPNTSPDHSIGRSDGRQIAPPTKNGHAPPPIESRKSSQSVNPYYVWTCNSAGGTTRPIKTRSVSPTEGTSRPVHTKGGPADPSQGRMSFGGTESLRVTVYNFSASEISTGNLFTNANKATNAMSRVRYATQAPDPIIERNIAREVTEKDRCAKDTHETGSLVSLPADIHFPSKDGCQEHPQKFKAARCRCPWATLTPCSTRDSLGGSMLSNEARPSNLGGWNRCPWGHLGISGAFRIYRHPRPRRIHVSPCHDTPILFGDGVKRCPWGHLGIPCAFPIYRHPKASKNPCHPTHDTPILRDHSAIFVRELLKKLKNCDKTDRRKSRRKNFPAIIPAVGRSDSLSVMPPDNIPRSLPTSGTE
ncbi:GAG-pre-integrase domain [Arabidopsis suecica]|uniref:GAG-pre-integrase domain n=1 Tax=Arabidopsis suecica TaxID=45249 RepID=A0A8T1XHG6_ARASU|nr:GAG-pre-integrase domain [Arabidopsis suecica]